MEVFWILVGIVSLIVISTLIIAAVSVWICNATNPCQHSYERVDTYNDKKMILVCRRCGKIKKLRK